MAENLTKAIITEHIRRDYDTVTYAIVFQNANNDDQMEIKKWLDDWEEYYEEIEDHGNFIDWIISKSLNIGIKAEVKSIDKVGDEPVITTIIKDDTI